MQSILKISISLIAAAAVVAAYCFYFPVIQFKRGKGSIQEVKYIEGIGDTVVDRHPWELEVRVPTEKESWHRGAMCLMVYAPAMIGIHFLWRQREKRYMNGRKKFQDGDLMVILGEPIQGELLMPIKALGDKRNSP